MTTTPMTFEQAARIARIPSNYTGKFDLEREVRRYMRAHHTLESSRPGTPADRAAHTTIERIVMRAEKSGNLQAFLYAAGIERSNQS